MKHIKLLASARVNGELRAPTDGVQIVEDDEADRLIAEGNAEDVSDDFAEKKEKSK
jgi:hypothetical protein